MFYGNHNATNNLIEYNDQFTKKEDSNSSDKSGKNDLQIFFPELFNPSKMHFCPDLASK